MIPITKPCLGQEELDAIGQALQSGWIVQGPFVQQFEAKFSAFTQSSNSVATNSCTSALHISVSALQLKPGDEVIVPAFTWVSTANVVEYMGATPIFCDINPNTFNIEPTQIENAITARTVGIIPVHLFGLSADMDPIMKIARKHGLWVIEDAACGLGAWYKGRHVGTIGNSGCFSFHPRKSITTGEGGMLITDDSHLAATARALRDHGASKTDHERHTGTSGFLLPEYHHLGYNYRMTDIQGAMGSVQMDRLSHILSARSRCAEYYNSNLAALDWLATPITPQNHIHGYQSYVCFFHPKAHAITTERLYEQRNRIMTELETKGVATRQGTHAPVLLHYYREKYGLHKEQFPNAYQADRLTLSLPMYAQMTSDEQDRVISTLLSAFDAI